MTSRSTLISVLALTLAACGDDGGSTAQPDAATTHDAPPPDTSTPTPVTLSNVPALADCPGGDRFSIAPVIPQEVGHLAAARLVPASYPVQITKVAYDLAVPAGGGDCDLSFAHTVEVYVDTAVAPNARPSTGTLVHSISVPAGVATDHTVELTLPSAVTLTTGQSLFVAVKLTGNDLNPPTKALCIGACRVATGAKSDVDYWSNAAAEPYAWADMVDDFGFTYNYAIRASGTMP